MATITASIRDLQENARNYGGEKEQISAYTVVGMREGKLVELVTCKSWMGRSRTASTVYSSVWVKMRGKWAAGKGTAGGYGYHKESAAIAQAIDSAGFDLSESISGRGEGMILDALEALARLAGGEGELLTVQN